MQQTPWWKQSVVYQIYPRSFMDSNGDGVGDLRGITSRLDYVKELGADVIWLSPVYESPNDDNGYDISDYRAIMKDFGTMADFDELLAQAHQRGLKIVMDLVANHTSDEHAWFAESRMSKDNPRRDYYFWREGKGDNPPNNWGSVFSGPAWEYDAATNMYYLHLFTKKQPDLNWDNPKVRDELFDMMTWWLDKGIDGFRMDVISMISKTPGLPDGPVREGALYGDFGPYTVHGPHQHDYLKEMNRRVLSRYNIMTVGEAAGVTVEEATKYAGFDSKELNMVFQFEHVELDARNGSKWDYQPLPLVRFKQVMAKWQVGLEGKAWNSLYWENHDQPRSVSRYGSGKEYWEKSAKMLATCLHMMKGTPYVYQGQELGMTNTVFHSLEECRDVEVHNAWREQVELQGVAPEVMLDRINYISRDHARTPMHWDDSPNAGFTSGEPWIAVNPNYTCINAARQVGDPASVFSYYKELIRLRKTLPVVVEGAFALLDPEDDKLFCYTRTLGGEKLLVLCSFSPQEAPFSAPEEFVGCAQLLLANYADSGALPASLSLRPYEARIYKL